GDGGCSDGDNDGVCDEVDLCPGLDDALIGTACDDGDPCTENDLYTLNCLCEGTPIPDCPPDDGCDNVLISQFSPSTLTHTGSGSSAVTLSFPPNNQDVSFTIGNLDARLNG